MTCGVEIAALAGRPAQRAPFVLPVTLLAGLGASVVADAMLRTEHSLALGFTVIVTLTWFGVASIVARSERNQVPLLCVVPPLLSGAMTMTTWLLTFVGGAWGIYLPFAVGCLMALSVPPMIVLHAIARRVGRARPGSILKQSDGWRVWFAGLAMLLCLNLLFMISASAVTPVRLSILVVTAGSLLILAVCDLSLTRSLAAVAAGAESRTDDRVDRAVPRLDLGVGDGRWFCNPHRGSAYRGAEKPAAVVVGALDWIQPLLRRRAVTSGCLALLAATALGFSVQAELTRPPETVTYGR
jgi:hypothetical protein